MESVLAIPNFSKCVLEEESILAAFRVFRPIDEGVQGHWFWV